MNIFEAGSLESAIVALIIVFCMFVAFIRETYPPEVTAIGGTATLLAFNILPYDRLIDVLSNPVPWTIFAMFIVVSALIRTGVLSSLTQFFTRIAKRSPALAIFAALLCIALGSAIMNNTPLMIVMIPIFVQLSHTIGCAPSRLLIPLSYTAIAGGSLTLLGTSTHRLVDDISQTSGLPPFSVLEILPIGLIVLVWTSLYLFLFAKRFLPDRSPMGHANVQNNTVRFFTEVIIHADSELIGQKATQIGLLEREDVTLIDILRNGHSQRDHLEDITLQQDDHILIKTLISQTLAIGADPDLRGTSHISHISATAAEVLITPNCGIVGRRLGELNFIESYAVYPICVHRRTGKTHTLLNNIVLNIGDSILLEGRQDDIKRASAALKLGNVTQVTARPFRRLKAPIAIGVLFGIALFTTLNVAPFLWLSIVGAAIVLLTGCVDSHEAFDLIDGRLIALIFAMLGVSAGLEASGAVELVASGLAPVLLDLEPMLIVLVIYLISNALTELLSNNAVGVIMAPIAIAVAHGIGCDPRPLVVTVMMAASASFSTPIGYQTNMLIYRPGGYRFSDFVKFGLPLNLSLALLVSMFIPWIWPLSQH